MAHPFSLSMRREYTLIFTDGWVKRRSQLPLVIAKLRFCI
jgi:hypothetical protein